MVVVLLEFQKRCFNDLTRMLVYILCVFHLSSRVPFMFYVCSACLPMLHLCYSCKYVSHSCSMYVPCVLHVCSMYVPCKFRYSYLFVPCMFYLGSFTFNYVLYHTHVCTCTYRYTCVYIYALWQAHFLQSASPVWVLAVYLLNFVLD